MISPRKPSLQAIARFLAEQEKLSFTYLGVGSSNAQPPSGYVVDHTRVKLGSGSAVFAAARRAIESWQQFQLGWVEALPRDTPIEVGRVIAVRAFALGSWSVNAARIVYVIDHTGPAAQPADPGRTAPDVVRQFGFAYGTLPGHMESGEERFLIELLADGSVWYDIIAFSRPRHPLARLAYPLVRRLQRKFGRASAAAMQAACAAI